MSSYEYIRGKGNRFTSDNQPLNRGRKPKLYTIAKKSYGITLDEFKEGLLIRNTDALAVVTT